MQHSEQMTAWVEVLEASNTDDELVELLEVNANRIPCSRKHRSQYDWFMEHWENLGEECFWDKEDRPDAGEYLITFHIEGEWTHSSNGDDYDEQIIVETIDEVDL